MDFSRILSFSVVVFCILIAFGNQVLFRTSYYSTDSYSLLGAPFAERKLQEDVSRDHSLTEQLQYDYYSESCPSAAEIIRSTVRKLYDERHDVAPALLRLLFHDCFIEGCDASVLLDTAGAIRSEKESIPNLSLKGFDVIDSIKSELEAACPGIVSCADTLVLAAREAVLLVGGNFYPLLTGRKDSIVAFPENATDELPTPDDDFSTAINSFATRGFDERETLSLLGAHSTGTVHCSFFRSRLFNFKGTGGPDPSIDPEFLEVLRSKCNGSHQSSSPAPNSPSLSAPNSPSLSPTPLSSNEHRQDPGIRMDYEGPGKNFGSVYYRALLQKRGLLFVDQQMTTRDDINAFVQAYASNVNLFHMDFSLSMMKLSNLKPLTSPRGEVRRNCRKVN